MRRYTILAGLVVFAVGCGGERGGTGWSGVTPFEVAPEVTSNAIETLEKSVGDPLPADYRRFLSERNGGFPKADCVRFEEDGRPTATDVFCLFSLGDTGASTSLGWHRETYAGRLPDGTLPIGRDSSGNLWLLNLRGPDAGSVHFWDHGTFDTFDETDLSQWPRVAGSFTDFLDGLTEYEPPTEPADVPSRYELVRQATEGMLERDAGFDARANAEYVWHCDCDDAGKTTMQFVRYEIHAVTHTDGYSFLRAIKGRVEKGPPRLPS